MFFRPAFWLGAGVVVAYEFLPQLMKHLRPAVIQTMKIGLAATDQLKISVAGFKESLEDMLAEARTLYEAEKGTPASGEESKPITEGRET